MALMMVPSWVEIPASWECDYQAYDDRRAIGFTCHLGSVRWLTQECSGFKFRFFSNFRANGMAEAR